MLKRYVSPRSIFVASRHVRNSHSPFTNFLNVLGLQLTRARRLLSSSFFISAPPPSILVCFLLAFHA